MTIQDLDYQALVEVQLTGGSGTNSQPSSTLSFFVKAAAEGSLLAYTRTLSIARAGSGSIKIR